MTNADIPESHEASAPPAMTPDEDHLSPGQVVGEYVVERRVGCGAMADVYSAIHPVIGKRAAIKVLHPSLGQEPSIVERFIQEARAINRIQHPNISDVFSFGTLGDGRAYFIMEWLNGETLGNRMRRHRLLFGDVLSIVDQVAAGLQAAHGAGIIHRDVKPDNVMLVPGGADHELVKLLDFGVAKFFGGPHAEASVAITGENLIVGTPGYLSPEQARCGDVDERADVYGLGAMAFEMGSGRLPFTAESPMALVAKHVCESPPAPSQFAGGLPPEFDDLVLRMLAKEPEARPSLAEVRAALAVMLGVPGPKDVALWEPAAPKGADIDVRAPAPQPASLPAIVQTLPYASPPSSFAGDTPGSGSLPPVAEAHGGAHPPFEGADDGRQDDDFGPPPDRRLAGRILGSLAVAAGLAVALVLIYRRAPVDSSPDSLPAARVAAAPAPAAPAAPAPAAPAAPVAAAPAPTTSESVLQPAENVGSPESIESLAASEPLESQATAPDDDARVAPPGHLALKLAPDDAQVELDGRVVSKAEMDPSLRVTRPGEHRLVVTAPRYKPYSTTLDVPAGETVKLDVTLKRRARRARARAHARRSIPSPPAHSAPHGDSTSPPPSEPERVNPRSDSDYVFDPFGGRR